MRPKHIIFDLDGTLLHFPHDFFLSRSREVFLSLGYPDFGLEELRHAFCKFDFFSVCNGADPHAISEQFWDRFKGGPAPKSEMIPGVPELLSNFRDRGLSISIATARDSETDTIHDELTALGIMHHVSAVASRTDKSITWTDKRGIIEGLCRSQQLDPGQTIMIGDTPSDIISAKAVGIEWTVAVLSGGIYREVLEEAQPNHIVNDVCCVLPLLR